MAGKTIPGKRPKRFKWLKRLVVLMVLYTIIGFLVVPAIIKSQMIKRLPAITKRQASVEKVLVNPYAMSLTIRGLSLKETNGEEFAGFDEFYINFQPVASLFKWTWVFSEISLKTPRAQLTRLADGSFNFANLIDTNAAPTPAAPKGPVEPPKLLVYLLSITNGSVGVNDLGRAEPFHQTFTPIDLSLTNLTTVRDKDSPYSFVARTGAGETFAWSGSVTANPLGSEGRFRLGGLHLPSYVTFAHDFARIDIASGLLDVAADYHYDSTTNILDLNVSKAAVHLTGLELKAAGTGESILTLPALSVTDTEASVLKRNARVGRVSITGGSVLARREHDGSINLLALLKLPAPAAPSNPPPKPAARGDAPWVAKIDDITCTNFTVKVRDLQPEKAAAINLDQIAFDVKGVSDLKNSPVTAALTLRYQETGNIAVNGSATLLPPSADLQLALTNVDIRPVQPYVEQFLKLVLTGGTFDLDGRAKFALSDAGAPQGGFTGNFGVNSFASTDDVQFKDFAKWDALNVTGVDFKLQPLSVGIEQVKFAGLNTTVNIGSNGSINLQSILRQAPSSASPTNAPPAAPGATTPVSVTGLPFPVTLGELLMAGCSFHFGDDSLEPHCRFEVEEFSGSVRGLSSQDLTQATVDFNGRVDAHSPFHISGRINPLSTNRFVDVTVAFTNTELTAFSPYSGKFAGYDLAKGKLSLDVHCNLDHDALKMEDNVFIDQFTFGAATRSTNATKLPVRLAIALLKDRNGRIGLNVPVAGRLDDPKFSVWPVVWQVVDNLLLKAATAPFALLGAAFGGGQELSFVQFDPGSTNLLATETKKLDTLDKALFERPAVNLEISSSVDPEKDRLPLARVKVEDQIKSLYVQELKAANKPVVSISEVVLPPEDHDRLLKQLHKQTIGQYEPTPVPTNAAAVDTNSIAARLAALPPDEAAEHGATSLLGRSATKGRKTAPAKASGAPKATASTAAASAQPMSRAELELADMEDQLVRRMQVTDDDFMELMRQRAKQVQAYLLKSGQIASERVFVLAPKPIDSIKPEDRVNLSLD